MLFAISDKQIRQGKLRVAYHATHPSFGSNSSSKVNFTNKNQSTCYPTGKKNTAFPSTENIEFDIQLLVLLVHAIVFCTILKLEGATWIMAINAKDLSINKIEFGLH